MHTKPSKEPKPENPLADIFVSYSYPDLKTAKFFAKWIGEAGMKVHMLEPGEGGGKSFPAAMGEALEGCERLLAVYTRYYDDSKACTAEIEAMWLRDPDARLGRIIIIKLDATPVPLRYANRDYWDFTKVPGDEVMDEFKRRIMGLQPIATSAVQKTRNRRETRTGVPVGEPSKPSVGGVSATITNNKGSVNIAGGDVRNEHHYHQPRVKKVLERRGDEVSNAEAAALLQKLRDWGRGLWDATSEKRRSGKTEGKMHQKVYGLFVGWFEIPRYDALPSVRFDEAMKFIEVEMAKLRPKLLRANPEQGQSSYIGSIKQAMKQMGVTNETYYPELATRLKLKPFTSITQLKPKDLKRVYNVARRDARTGR